ncbi:hypothetical protein SAMN06295888_1458 [Desulfonatronum zhilinae]|nr:hypothetical protein SAMN06295888_1458 [Desulfonatronum zhilinae]
MKRIRTLTGAGLVVRLDGQGGLEVEGLKAVDPRGADELRRYIRENKAQIILELLLSEVGAKIEGGKLLFVPHLEGPEVDPVRWAKGWQAWRIMQEQAAPVILEQLCSIENGEPCPESAARDLIELDQRGFIRLDLTSDPPTFTLADGHGYGEGDRQYVQALIDEAGAALDSVRL